MPNKISVYAIDATAEAKSALNKCYDTFAKVITMIPEDAPSLVALTCRDADEWLRTALWIQAYGGIEALCLAAFDYLEEAQRAIERAARHLQAA